MSDSKAEGRLAGKTVGILAEYNVEDLEFHYPRLRLIEEGATIKIIASSADFKGKGKYGVPVVANTSIADVSEADLDALIIPGGFAPDYWRRDQRYNTLVREVFEAGKPVAAICHGPWMLVSAKILKGKKATCFCSIMDDVINAGNAALHILFS